MINNELVKEMLELTEWIKIVIGKTANFEINFWSHTCSDNQSTSYRLWVDGLLNKSEDKLEDLVSLIPSIKSLCTLNKELNA